MGHRRPGSGGIMDTGKRLDVKCIELQKETVNLQAPRSWIQSTRGFINAKTRE